MERWFIMAKTILLYRKLWNFDLLQKKTMDYSIYMYLWTGYEIDSDVYTYTYEQVMRSIVYGFPKIISLWGWGAYIVLKKTTDDDACKPIAIATLETQVIQVVKQAIWKPEWKTLITAGCVKSDLMPYSIILTIA